MISQIFSAVAALHMAAPASGEGPKDTVTKTKVLPYTVRYEFSNSLSAGKVVLKSKGKNGKIVTTYQPIEKDGKVVGKTPLFSKRYPATNEVRVVGKGGYSVSRGSYTGRKILNMEATAYDPFPPGGSGTGETASGLPARFGIAAVDPRVIKLGTLLYVEGYGFALAADTGGDIKGNRIDLCFNTRGECTQYGRRQVKVHVLNKQ